ncbi:hypothetical protein GTA08_BOTSDO08940 [Botryosphaeria dothidea]|uniref:Uncharacterized protein n=1 Tax=Botryosphaeria dothidea TaxID=55169 RepID=A0A8H4MY28_9PEZI|nr:hypothetical protein GTA08_BOTSDO08940 [Botryosphaeria dothidea]
MRFLTTTFMESAHDNRQATYARGMRWPDWTHARSCGSAVARLDDGDDVVVTPADARALDAVAG